MRLKRHPANPVLAPDPNHAWEALNVFNCGVVHHNGLFHMLYRAQGFDYISRIGYAVSADGVHWNRLGEPVLAPHMGDDDYRGNEDPRVTPLEGAFYMCYTAYGAGGLYFPMVARSENLIVWEDIGPLERARNKDHVLFPQKIAGRYAILHRRPPDIWIAFSDDLVNWTDHRVIMSPRPDNSVGWDNTCIGASGVPVRCDAGWLLFYHGYNEFHVYRQSVALLDGDDPTRVISRPQEFFMEPEETWEFKGDVPNVVFSCANPVVNDTLYFYYAGADRLIGLATAPLADVIDFARKG
ncbi:MAG: glycosidase [Anaerolineae bacterium]|nr:glycosidase [Anaerolineae bacterium]